MYIWSLNPLSIAAIVLLADFGITMAIRILIEGRLYFGKWWSFRIGDSLLLPSFAFFASFIIKTQINSIFFTSFWIYFILILAGYSYTFISEYLLVRHNVFTLKQEFIPSKMYHSLIFGPLFALLVATTPIIISSRIPLWAFIGSLIAVALYLTTYLIDLSDLKNKRLIA